MELTIAETPVSYVVLGPERVYKMKRPVKFDFIDLKDAAARKRMCDAEVRLNSRLSSDVYEGVGSLTGPDGQVEPLVVMRRLPATRSLARLVATDAPDCLQQLNRVAAVLAEFHRSQVRSSPVDDDCRPPAVQRLWRELMVSLEPYLGTVLDSDLVAHVARLAGRYLLGRETLLAERVGSGRAVDGHGDLSADDVFCLEDGPRLLDCLEFDDRLRHVDGLADAAFLALDLERLGRDDLAWEFLRRYGAEASDLTWPDSLVHHWMAYRAMVRAKIACLRWAERSGAQSAADTGSHGGLDEANEAQVLLGLAVAHAEAATVRLVVIGGVPGSGNPPWPGGWPTPPDGRRSVAMWPAGTRRSSQPVIAIRMPAGGATTTACWTGPRASWPWADR